MAEFNLQEAMKLRLDGMSYADIGRKYHMSREGVRQKIGKRPRGQKVVEDIKIPVLRHYFQNNNESVREFCRDVCGNVDYHSFERFYQNFLFWVKREHWTGTKKFTINQMVRILEKTGASLNDFYREE